MTRAEFCYRYNPSFKMFIIIDVTKGGDEIIAVLLAYERVPNMIN